MNWIDQTEQNRLFAWDLYYRTAVLRQGAMNSDLSFWSSFHSSVCFLIHKALFPDIAHELWDPEELKSDRVQSFVKIFIFPKTSKMGRKNGSFRVFGKFGHYFLLEAIEIEILLYFPVHTSWLRKFWSTSYRQKTLSSNKFKSFLIIKISGRSNNILDLLHGDIHYRMVAAETSFDWVCQGVPSYAQTCPDLLGCLRLVGRSRTKLEILHNERLVDF